MLSNHTKVIINAIINELRQYNEKHYSIRIPITIRRIQKLLFFCEIDYMRRNNGNPLLEEDYYAWTCGPAIPSIYSEYNEVMWKGSYEYPCFGSLTMAEKQIVNEILRMTVNLDTLDLEKASCTVGSPWARAFCPDNERHLEIIPKNEIYLFYSTKDWVNEIFNVE